MKRTALILAALAALNLSQVSFAEESKDKVIAKVGKINIMQSQLDREMEALKSLVAADKQDELRPKILDRLIDQVVMYEAAKKDGVTKSAEFKQKMQDMERGVASTMLAEKVLAEKITDESVKAHYESIKDKFAQNKVKARHILVEDAQTAEKLIKQLEAGADFSKLAQANSTGPSAGNGGDLGWFNAGEMVPEFSKAAFALKKGEFTKAPVETQFGFHVILVEDKNDGEVIPFEQVQQIVRQDLTKTSLEAFIDAERKKANIKLMN